MWVVSSEEKRPRSKISSTIGWAKTINPTVEGIESSEISLTEWATVALTSSHLSSAARRETSRKFTTPHGDTEESNREIEHAKGEAEPGNRSIGLQEGGQLGIHHNVDLHRADPQQGPVRSDDLFA